MLPTRSYFRENVWDVAKPWQRGALQKFRWED